MIRLNAITAFRLSTGEPERLVRFYEGLGFASSNSEEIPDDELKLLGLRRGGSRVSLRLGEQHLDLDTFLEPGRPYPAKASSADLCFQHLALVTDNAAAAWAKAEALGAKPISFSGPVMLPGSIGGVTAVKFRDPEGHPLEFLQFPSDNGGHQDKKGLLGIDHSAISVSDAAASCRFYEALGLTIDGPTFNHGPTQAALDGLPRAEADVVPMLPPQQTPHLELLAYRTPVGRPIGQFEVIDIAATRIVWASDWDALFCDPDGHFHQLQREKIAKPEPQ